MWQCPKCGRNFKSIEQLHYCGKIETVEQYILEQSEEVRPVLQKIREVIRNAAPNAVEKISWRMPTYWQGENLIHFAAFKKHIGVYPGSEATTFFAERLTEYKTTKGAVRLPLNKPVPYDLIEEITLWRLVSATGSTETEPKAYEYKTIIQQADKGGAYVEFPYDVRKEFGKGRAKVRGTFDGVQYDGSIVNMGVKNPDGSVCYIIGVRKDIRSKISKQPGDTVNVVVRERT